MSGKIVFVSFKMKRTIDGSGYREAVVASTQGAIAAVKKSVIDYIMRSVATGNNRLAHTGVMNYEEDVSSIPAALDDGLFRSTAPLL